MRHILTLAFLLNLVGCASQYQTPTSCSDMKSCTKYVRAKLISNLELDKSFLGQSVEVEFFLNDNAEVIEYKVANQSGLLELDSAAINAIKKSSPFTAIKDLA